MGAIDENGIYQYTEDEAAAPGGLFSELLNKLASSTSTMAAAVLSRLTAIETTLTSTQIATSGIFEATSGWDLSRVAGIKKSGLGFVSADVTRTGSDINIPPSSNISNLDVCSLQTNWLALPDGYYPFSPASAGPLAAFYLTSGSTIRIGAAAASTTIATGDTLSFTGVYPLA